MSNAMSSIRRRGPEDRWATHSYDRSHAQRARHGINRRRLVGIRCHRTHLMPHATHATTAFPASNPWQATTPVSNTNINPHSVRQA